MNNVMLATALAAALAVLMAANRELVDGGPCPTALAAEVHYSPKEDLEAIDIRLIDSARSAIDMDAYVLTDRAVADALDRAVQRGAKVRIWRDAEMAAETHGELVAGAADRVKPRGELMHLKSYCVDGATLRTGAANFSRSGETRQDNDLVILRGPKACAGFEAKFNTDWGK